MKRKFWSTTVVFVLSLCCVILFQSTKTYASMQDEAESFEMGETYSGYTHDHRYFVFTLSAKSHVTFWNTKDEGTENVYNASGNIVLNNDDIRYIYNTTSDTYSGSLYRVLSAGTYYIDIYWQGNFKFKVQAEDQIKLPKGKITSLTSSKKGQMEVRYQKASDAIGYRIQYSTDYRFKKGVKTVYATSTGKTIKSLKKGARYYVKVCPFTVYDDGTKVFGQNSYIKTVTVRKK